MKDFERQKGEREAQHAAQMKAHRESVALAQQQSAAAAARGIDTGPVYCPSCRREYPAGTAFCAFDSNRLVAIRGHEQLMSGPAGGICPVCRKGWNPGVKLCPEHGEELVPAAVAGAGAAPAQGPAQRGKICPSCGGRFEGGSTFCAKDGTQLVLLN
jgi:predicted amidophosphoribosyltransferase